MANPIMRSFLVYPFWLFHLANSDDGLPRRFETTVKRVPIDNGSES
jgi:hypothetical protein